MEIVIAIGLGVVVIAAGVFYTAFIRKAFNGKEERK